MKSRIIILSTLAVIATVVLSACSAINPVGKVAKDAYDIPYTVLDNYFVRNDVDVSKQQKLILTNQADFDSFFGMAATMGYNGTPTDVNFKTQYVVAIILPETDRSTTVTPTRVRQNGNAIIVDYKVTKGDRNSYTLVPFGAVVLDKPATDQQMEVYFNQQ